MFCRTAPVTSPAGTVHLLSKRSSPRAQVRRVPWDHRSLDGVGSGSPLGSRPSAEHVAAASSQDGVRARLGSASDGAVPRGARARLPRIAAASRGAALRSPVVRETRPRNSTRDAAFNAASGESLVSRKRRSARNAPRKRRTDAEAPRGAVVHGDADGPAGRGGLGAPSCANPVAL